MKTNGPENNPVSPGIPLQNEGLLQVNIRGKMVMKMKRPEETKDEVDQSTVDFLLKIHESKTPE